MSEQHAPQHRLPRPGRASAGRPRRRGWRGAAGQALGVALLAVGLAACGGGGGGGAATGVPTPTPSQFVAADVSKNWFAFFDGRTPPDTKISLLQNGEQFAQVIRAQSQNPMAQQTTVQVTRVDINGQQATVTYTILINGQPVLPNQTGTAVLVNGTWKVSQQSFCQLLALQGQPPAPCGPVSRPAAPTTSR